MGLISKIFSGGVGAVAGAVADVAEVFTPNAERDAQRAAERFTSAQQAYAAERGGKGWFGSLVDALNRLPRPMMAFGVIFLFWNAMQDPISFTIRMQGMQTIPQELWWLIGAVVSFYFGARELKKSREARPVHQVIRNIQAIEALKVRDHITPGVADDPSPEASIAVSSGAVTKGNAAIEAWKHTAQQ